MTDEEKVPVAQEAPAAPATKTVVFKQDFANHKAGDEIEVPADSEFAAYLREKS